MNKYKVAKYEDLLKIKNYDNGEKLIDPREINSEFVCQYEKEDMKKYLDNNIIVRESVARKLINANKELKLIQNSLFLKLVYGYRHPDIQKKYFLDKKKLIKQKYPNLNENEVISKTHNLVAVPNVAGHPTGGAIDITISSDKGDLDMGTKIADFSDLDKIRTNSDNLTTSQKQNRRLLHDLLYKQGFVPFYGEWWHFSYGDKEWAFFYDKEYTLFSPITVDKYKR